MSQIESEMQNMKGESGGGAGIQVYTTGESSFAELNPSKFKMGIPCMFLKKNVKGNILISGRWPFF